MLEASSFLPHEPPAVMLEAFEAWTEAGCAGLRGTVQLDRCRPLWLTDQGLPCAFAVEILGQLSAVYLRRLDACEELVGGRLATLDEFTASAHHLPASEPLEVCLSHLGGSSAGYHKFRGRVHDSAGKILVSSQFSVVAFRRP